MNWKFWQNKKTLAVTIAAAAVVVAGTAVTVALLQPKPATQEQAQTIALEHAGVEEANVTFYRVKQDYENGRAVYEVEFYTDTTEYDYEIAQDTGEVLSYDSDIEDWAIPQEGTPVTLEQATQLVVDRVEGLTAQEVRIHQEHDDGRTVYEGEAVFQGAQYEFEIDASTGAFLDWSVESR